MQRAFVDRDVATLEKILTDDYVLVLPSGTERTRAPILADVASPDIVFEINESSGWEVRVHGDTAIVVALLHQKGTSHGQAVRPRREVLGHVRPRARRLAQRPRARVDAHRSSKPAG